MTWGIREATAEDVPELARLHVETFNEAHRGGQAGGPSYELREHQWRESFDQTDPPWFCFVAHDDSGALVGFAKGTRHDGGILGFEGELNKLYVLRRYHRQGIGRQLVARVVERFLQENIRSMLLFGQADNPSNGFYQRLGAQKIYSANGEFHGAYGWPSLSALLDTLRR